MKIIIWDASCFRHSNNSDYKSLIARIFYENTLKMEAASSKKVMKNLKIFLFVSR